MARSRPAPSPVRQFRRLDARTAGTQLPAPLSTLIGREQDIADATALLAHSRLVTLTGPGGVGKTRLAMAVARDLPGRFPDGRFFVDLARLRDPAHLLSAIAEALGERERSNRPLSSTLIDRLQGRCSLLVIDNFEHLLEGASVLEELLAQAADLTALVTSRAALHLTGERRYPVSPLALPPANPAGVEALLHCPAVTLFTERAQSADPAFALTAANAGAVAELCRRLDGLPLALELAAAWVSVLTIPALVERLERGLPALSNGARTAPVRQRTVRATLQWSYDLLARVDQALFSTLAVFAGGWSLHAAEAVCGEGRDVDVLAGLARLVDFSLVRQQPDHDEPRFSLLETVREFAGERLKAFGQDAKAHCRHAYYYRDLAVTFPSDLLHGVSTVAELLPREHPAPAPGAHWSDDESVRMRRVGDDQENYRQALRWFLEHHDGASALALSTALSRFWDLRGQHTEGRRWLTSALEQAPSDPALDRLRVRALAGAGGLAGLQGELDQATRLTGEALLLAQRIGDRPAYAHLLITLGIQAMWQNELDRAHALLTTSLKLLRALDDKLGIARSLVNLAHVARQRHDLARARRWVEECEPIFRELSYTRGLTPLLQAKGRIALARGDYPGARSAFGELLTAGSDSGDPWTIIWALHGFVDLALLARQRRPAAELLGALEALRAELQLSPRGWTSGWASDLSQVRATLVADLGEPAFEALRDTGASLSLTDACAAALSLPAEPVVKRSRFTSGDPAGLTPREIEVLRLLASGMSNREIATALVVSLSTVLHHVSSILAKTGSANRTAASHFAQRHGLLGE